MNLIDEKNEFQNYLQYKFASNEREWKPWLNLLAKKYYLLFLENKELIFKMITPYLNRKKAKISIAEAEKINLIMNLFALFDAIKYNSEDKTISLNHKIINSFIKIENQNEKQKINLVKKEIEKDIYHMYSSDEDPKKGDFFVDSFKELQFYFSTLLSFYRELEFREFFFSDVILPNNLNDLSSNILFLENNNTFVSGGF